VVRFRGGKQHTVMRAELCCSLNYIRSCRSSHLLVLAGALAAVRLLAWEHALSDRVWELAPGSYHVIVVGAGTGGTAAAIQAARLGARVALLEETDCIGGQMNCAAVTSMDEGAALDREDGIYGEFIARVQAHYGARSIATCYWIPGTACFEPHVGQIILRQMLAEAGVDVYTRKEITSLLRSHNRVYGVGTRTGENLLASVVIDATEYGDLLPLAGVDYRLGNGRAFVGAPSYRCVQDITYTAVLRKYPYGVPERLRISGPPPDYISSVAKFRLHAATIGTSAFAGGDPLDPAGPYPYSWPVHVAYRGMPDSRNPDPYTAADQDRITKTGVNWANDSSYTAADFDRDARFRANCQAKLHTLHFLYYVQTELGQRDWSIADDESFDSPWNVQENSCPNIPAELKELERRMPLMPYVRESRRLVGKTTVTASDILRVSTPSGVMGRSGFDDGIAVGNYPTDLHGCKTSETLETGLESLGERQNRTSGPFQIPLAALIPESVDGFVAAEKNFSQTRLVNAASRVQPTTMLVGQAAGALSALAALAGVTPRQIRPEQVQSVLLDAGHRISRFTFADVPRGSPEWKAAQLVSTRGVMTGYPGDPPRFGVHDWLTRREAAVTVTRFARSDTTAPESSTFNDVPNTDAAFGAIEAMVRAGGITTDCSSAGGMRLFCPDAPVTRGQMAAFLTGALSLPLAGSGQRFVDVAPGQQYYSSIQMLAQAGLAEPCPGQADRFCPDSPVTRGDAARMFARLIVAGRQPPAK
jgi:hypothetical protein